MKAKTPKPAVTRTLRFIAVLKLVSALILVAIGCEIFHILDKDLVASLQNLAHHLHLRPDLAFIDHTLSAASGLTPMTLRAIDAGTFFYALLYLVEGWGLLGGKKWAEYLTIIATALLLPIEAYEIVHHATMTKLIIFALNLAIVFYLVQSLRHRKS